MLCGVLQGAGRQAIGFAANLVTCWVVGLPLAWWWGSQQRGGGIGGGGATGMWRAMAAVTGLQILVLGAAVARFDWRAEARRARAGVVEGTRSMGDLHPLFLASLGEGLGSGSCLLGGGGGGGSDAESGSGGEGAGRSGRRASAEVLVVTFPHSFPHAFPHSLHHGTYEPSVASQLE